MILFYDTETTGLPNNRAGHDHHSQPDLLQLGATLCEENGLERASLNVIIRQVRPVPDEVTSVHGITTEIANRYGVIGKVALHLFAQLLSRASLVVGHNIEFDDKIITTALHREGLKDWIEPFRLKPRHCTMIQTYNICKIPATPKQLAAGYGPYKNPRLEEAIRFFFNEDLSGAHDALVDVRACARIYFHLKENPQ